jgi:hypothetical protein
MSECVYYDITNVFAMAIKMLFSLQTLVYSKLVTKPQHVKTYQVSLCEFNAATVPEYSSDSPQEASKSDGQRIC